jgi:hypothetical protein
MAKRMVKSGTKLVVWFLKIKICETKVKWFQLKCELWVFLGKIIRMRFHVQNKYVFSEFWILKDLEHNVSWEF